ncbi:MAG TPA: hypothetical protein VGD77_17765 [Gemmatimonadaceae bacterium]
MRLPPALLLIASILALPARAQEPRAAQQGAPTPTPAAAAAVTNVLYVIDGTGAKAEHRDVLWRLQARLAREGGDTARYWEGVKDVVRARDAEALYDSVAATVCRDVRPRAEGGLGARNVYLAGYSRGAIIAVRVANEVRRRCDAHVAFLGLVDAVNTSIAGWPTAVDSGIPVAVHLVKPRNATAGPLATTHVAGVRELAHPDRGNRITGWGAIDHTRLVCPVGHERDADGRQATWTESTLLDALRAAADSAGAPMQFTDTLAASCPPGLKKFFHR